MKLQIPTKEKNNNENLIIKNGGFFLGKKHSKESKRKMSEAHRGKHSSPNTEFKKGMIHPRGMLGKHCSEEHKRKVSETLKKIGHKPPSFLGKHLSEESRMKISKALKGKLLSVEHKKKLSEVKKGKKPWGGKKPSQKTIEKIRKAKIGKNNPMWKGGITPIYFKERNNFLLKEWKRIRKWNYFLQELS